MTNIMKYKKQAKFINNWTDSFSSLIEIEIRNVNLQ